MWLEAEPRIYQRFLFDAAGFWQGHVLPPDPESFVVVEAFHHDIRVTLRNLTVANSLRRLMPARLVVLTGVEPKWPEILNAQFDVTLMRQLAEAYGATDIVDLHELVDQRLASPAAADARWLGGPPPGPQRPIRPIDSAALEATAYATFARLEQVPRLTDEMRTSPRYAACRSRATAFTAVFDDLFSAGNPIALVTSHVDYDQWGLAVQAAQRAQVPVIHVQTTGALKAYTLFPENARGEPSFRAELTPQLGEFFQDRLWAQRDRLRRNAERSTWRGRRNLGRPSWWRTGVASYLELTNPVERRQLRAHAAARLGLDPDRPTAVVFNHAVSDALGTNREVFSDLADWFEQTAAFAAAEPAVNWLLLDHPSQILYDRTEFFPSLADRYAGVPHMVFRRSQELSKNVMWSLADLGLTVRGSIANEMPAYGIPVIQSGWSESSACGLSIVADDQVGYWRLLEDALGRLVAKEDVITPEQVERARLWLWLYRSAADVVSGLVPHWDTWPADHLLTAVQVHMRQVEPDGEPVFAAVDRMWHGREPILTRLDLVGAGASDGPALPHSREPGTPSIVSRER